MNEQQTTAAAAFRRLLKYLNENKYVQNIVLMLMADFCRNCLSKWYMAGTQEQGVEIDYDQAGKAFYGMPFSEWKANHQQPAIPEQLAAFETRQSR